MLKKMVACTLERKFGTVHDPIGGNIESAARNSMVGQPSFDVQQVPHVSLGGVLQDLPPPRRVCDGRPESGACQAGGCHRPLTNRRTKYDIRDELPKKLVDHSRVGLAIRFKPELIDTDRLEIATSAHQKIVHLAELKTHPGCGQGV